MRIALTGTPGVGKTEVARLLKGKHRIASVLELAEKFGCVVDREEDDGEVAVIDVDALAEKVRDFDGIIEGHLSHLLEPDAVVVLRCNPLVLKERLMERGWSEEKVMENVEAELLDVILVEALDVTDRVYEIDTTGRSAGDVARDVEEILEALKVGGRKEEAVRRKFKPGIDWLSMLEDRIEEVARRC